MKHKQFAVIGLGRFGTSVAQTLYHMGHDVLAVDISEERVNSVMKDVTHVVQVDSTNEAAIRSLGLDNFDVVIVSIGQDVQASILTTLILKELGIKNIVAKARTELHGKVLYKIGANRVVYPEWDMGVRVAHNLVSANILDFIELSDDYSIVEIKAPPNMVGKTLQQLALRAKMGVTILAIKGEEGINVSPGATDRVAEGEILVLVGKNEQLQKIEERL
jgi:trk system potassium uptake protein